jgi:hypothetical protein
MKLSPKKIIFILILIVFLFSNIKNIEAEDKINIILTWEANNLYPSDYTGKAWATKNNEILVSATVLKNNKIIDNSNINFSWFLNGNYFNKGVGLDNINFHINNQTISEYSTTVKINIGDKNFEKRLNIPIKKYDAVINKYMPNNYIKLGDIINLELIPYFFNVDNFNNLNFLWNISNNKTEEKKNSRISLKIENNNNLLNNNIYITGWVSSKENPIDSAKSNLILKINE